MIDGTENSKEWAKQSSHGIDEAFDQAYNTFFGVSNRDA